MADETKKKFRNIFFYVNIVLIIILAVLLWQKYYKSSMQLDLKYDEKSASLTGFISEHFEPGVKNIHALVYFFNDLPVVNDIGTISKLYRKHKDDLDFFVFFHKKFKFPYKVEFPYAFVPNTKLDVTYNGNLQRTNSVVLLNNGRVKHCDVPLKILDMNFLVEKHIHPDRDYKSYAMSGKRLRAHLVKKLKDGGKQLIHLKSDKEETISNFKEYSKIHFIVGGCTSCELKKFVNQLKIRQILDDKKEMVIFPIFADESELQPIVKSEQLSLPVYIDYNDQFELFSVITGEKNKMLTIEASELEEKEVSE